MARCGNVWSQTSVRNEIFSFLKCYAE